MYYGYDHLDRLVEVGTGQKTTAAIALHTNNGYNNTSYSYDKRGNFIDVTRKHNDVMIDQLHYNYIAANSNQIESVDEAASNDKGYQTTGTGHYEYDDNGNMDRDPQKGISITYNHLDLPVEITWDDGRKMTMLYDADGNLHRRELFDSENLSIRKHDYLGQLEYIDGYRYAVTHSEGRIVNRGLEGFLEYLYLDHQQSTAGLFEAQQIESIGNIIDETTQYDASESITLNGGFEVLSSAILEATIDPPPAYVADWQYEWTITDHLGNLKLAYTGSDINNLTVLQQQDYFAYGMSRDKNLATTLENKYQFNSIEEVNEFGLDWSMAAYRSLQSDMGIWGAVDPKAESLYGMSPYCAMNNNPISFTDPAGDFPWLAVGIAAAFGGFSGHQVGKAQGASGWGMFGYIAGGALIGGTSAAVGSTVTTGLGRSLGTRFGGLIATGIGGATGGAVASGGFAGLAGQNVLNGTWKGALSGVVGSASGGYIGGGEGAFFGGALSGGLNSGLNGGDFVGTSLFSGAISAGVNELTSLLNYNKFKGMGGTLSRKQFRTMTVAAQRSFTRGREFGAWFTSDGDVQMWNRGEAGRVKLTPRPSNATGEFHTHPSGMRPEPHSLTDMMGSDVARTNSYLVARKNWYTYAHNTYRGDLLRGANSLFNPYPYSLYWWRS